MALSLHVGYGLNEARQFTKNLSYELYSAVYDTVSVTNSLSYTEQTSGPVKSNLVGVFCV